MWLDLDSAWPHYHSRRAQHVSRGRSPSEASWLRRDVPNGRLDCYASYTPYRLVAGPKMAASCHTCSSTRLLLGHIITADVYNICREACHLARPAGSVEICQTDALTVVPATPPPGFFPGPWWLLTVTRVTRPGFRLATLSQKTCTTCVERQVTWRGLLAP